MEIKLELSNINDATNRFNKRELNKELHDYLKDKCKFKIIKTSKIKLNVSGLKNEEDRLLLCNVIHDHYETTAALFKKFDLVDNYFRLFLLLLGSIAIFLSNKLPTLLSELFLIAGWVLVWEIFYDLLFNEIKRKRDFKIYEALKNCEINFKN